MKIIRYAKYVCQSCGKLSDLIESSPLNPYSLEPFFPPPGDWIMGHHSSITGQTFLFCSETCRDNWKRKIDERIAANTE